MALPAELAEIVTATSALAERFTRHEHRLYLVGGVVRDRLLGRPVDGDVDLTTDARPDQIRAVLDGWDHVDAIWTQGERFGTIGCRVDGRAYEITTHRAEAYIERSRKPVVEYSDDIAVDLSRRDFTVNAIAVELPGGTLVDPHGGRADLTSGVLRTPIGAEASFSDDPLRMIRAARFTASHGFEPSGDVVEAMRGMSDRLSIVAVERVRGELDRLLVTPRPSVGLELLAHTGLLRFLLPEHAAGPAERLETTLDRVDRTEPDLTARLAVLLDGWVTPRRRLRALRSSNAQIGAVVAVSEALDEARAHGDDASRARRVVAAAGDHLDAALLALAGGGGPAGAELAAAIDEARRRGELDAVGPQLDGSRVMALLDVPPGPAVGEALDFLAELALREGRLPTEEVEARLVAWWVDHQPGLGAG